MNIKDSKRKREPIALAGYPNGALTIFTKVAQMAEWTKPIYGQDRTTLDGYIQTFLNAVFSGVSCGVMNHRELAHQCAKILAFAFPLSLVIPQFQAAFAQWMNIAPTHMLLVPYIQYCYEPVVSAIQSLEIQSQKRLRLLHDFKRFSSLGVPNWPQFNPWAFASVPSFHLSSRKMNAKFAKNMERRLVEEKNRYAANLPRTILRADDEQRTTPMLTQSELEFALGLPKVLPDPQVAIAYLTGKKLAEVVWSGEAPEQEDPLDIAGRQYWGCHLNQHFNDKESNEELMQKAFKPGRAEVDPILNQWDPRKMPLRIVEATIAARRFQRSKMELKFDCSVEVDMGD